MTFPVWLFVDLFWSLLSSVAVFKFFSAFNKSLKEGVPLIKVISRSRFFWRSLFYLLGMYFLFSAGSSILNQHRQTALERQIATPAPLPPFDCEQVKKIGGSWYIKGPITIRSMVLSNDLVSPHGIKIGDIDVYTYIELRCGVNQK
ncbi:hypothetical protein HLH26_12770 [Gluconacetobacter sp. 1b LMG 1731]|uniref:Uncharacterized protein n=1 Tax=Gluconacetobacter dulcium TaxID=2729096 RepID=A0A7W4NWE1_9PROT|nr:hypothetical protein [Gluconacetobacter dulcium]MBB2165390.1 hypothetical protein [Gluconacetobacter dulcium]MBB2194443.1 hypothetical protein [Gluconacetobacter dulcium]